LINSVVLEDLPKDKVALFETANSSLGNLKKMKENLLRNTQEILSQKYGNKSKK